MRLSVQVDPVARLCGQVRRSYNIVDESGQAVAVLTNTPQARELASLIAAAPDLVQALEACVVAISNHSIMPGLASWSDVVDAQIQAHAALTRARGVTP